MTSDRSAMLAKANMRRHFYGLADTVDSREGSSPQVFWCEVRDARVALAENDALYKLLWEARQLRLVSPEKAVDPKVHTPEKIRRYLQAHGWTPVGQSEFYWETFEPYRIEFVPNGTEEHDTYTYYVGWLASVLVADRDTGELQILAEIDAIGMEVDE